MQPPKNQENVRRSVEHGAQPVRPLLRPDEVARVLRLNRQLARMQTSPSA